MTNFKMTPADFAAWRELLGLTKVEAARRLGKTDETIGFYEAGRRPDGRPVRIPLSVALACAAIAHGLPPWGAPRRG